MFKHLIRQTFSESLLCSFCRFSNHHLYDLVKAHSSNRTLEKKVMLWNCCSNSSKFYYLICSFHISKHRFLNLWKRFGCHFKNALLSNWDKKMKRGRESYKWKPRIDNLNISNFSELCSQILSDNFTTLKYWWLYWMMLIFQNTQNCVTTADTESGWLPYKREIGLIISYTIPFPTCAWHMLKLNCFTFSWSIPYSYA